MCLLRAKICFEKNSEDSPNRKILRTFFKQFEALPIPSLLGLPPAIQKIFLNELKAAAVASPLVALLSLIILILSEKNICSSQCGSPLKVFIACFICSSFNFIV